MVKYFCVAVTLIALIKSLSIYTMKWDARPVVMRGSPYMHLVAFLGEFVIFCWGLCVLL